MHFQSGLGSTWDVGNASLSLIFLYRWDEKLATLPRRSTLRSARGHARPGKERGMKQSTRPVRSVIGIDLGDRYSYLHELDMTTGETLSQTRISTSPAHFRDHFNTVQNARIALGGTSAQLLTN